MELQPFSLFQPFEAISPVSQNREFGFCYVNVCNVVWSLVKGNLASFIYGTRGSYVECIKEMGHLANVSFITAIGQRVKWMILRVSFVMKGRDSYVRDKKKYFHEIDRMWWWTYALIIKVNSQRHYSTCVYTPPITSSKDQIILSPWQPQWVREKCLVFHNGSVISHMYSEH